MNETIDPLKETTEWYGKKVKQWLIEDVLRAAESNPDMQALGALDVKQFTMLSYLIPLQPVTPMRVAAMRLKELTRAD
jgi:hypothetical protein